MNKRNKLAILINPPVYDTQYWARWSMPHGLLKVATWLREEGYDLKLFDCLNPYGEDSGVIGKTVDFESYDAVRKEKKSVVVLGTNIERNEPNGYKLNSNEKWKYIFGMPRFVLEQRLDELKQDVKIKEYQEIEIWVTSIMTYWWESTHDVIQAALSIFPDAKVRVGGIYPTLTHKYNHPQTKLGITPLVIKGDQLDLNNEEQMSNHLIVYNEIKHASNKSLALDLYPDSEKPPYTILTTSRGCPHICAYCASNILNDGTKVSNRTLEDVMEEIRELFRQGTRVFCFYEDNLLMKMQEFKNIIKAVMADKSLHGIKLFAPEGIEIGVAMSDRKRYLLKLREEDRIIATFTVESEYKLKLEQGEKSIKSEDKKVLNFSVDEDLTQGAVEVIKQDGDLVKLLIADTDEVILRKVYKDNGRHELDFENEAECSLGLYLVGVPEVVYLMHQAGFERIYLPLETIKKETNARWNRSWNSNLKRFEALLQALTEVGYDPRRQNINAFVMFGLPGEDIEEVYDTALYASERVGSVIPMLFTPVPSTQVFDMYQDYISENDFDLQHLNGKLLPFFNYLKKQLKDKDPDRDLKIEDYTRLESFMQRINTKVLGGSVNIYGETKVANTFRKVYGNYQSIL
ncbi:radical SAM protein [Fictibacillus sp. FJAT-27399]|uniref:radical SAM protein n=1 Tax=Fictibacillus sp. FJAT-27399 TaxID=1729689 RepID=UPI0007853B4D|nr:radical SAM protein [Fictibacillus sp. FJAT-27399]